MEDLQKKWHLFLKKNNLKINQEVLSMLLGSLVVILIAILAYNYFHNRVSGNAATTVSPVSVTETKDGSPSGQIGSGQSAVALPATHTVASGETLWIIAEKYFGSGYNFVDISVANNLANPDQIEAGQQIVIPKAAPKTITVAAEISPVVVDSKIDGNSYTVLRGDNLWMIAVRAYGDGYKWVDIARANNLANPGLIFSGNNLVIPR